MCADRTRLVVVVCVHPSLIDADPPWEASHGVRGRVMAEEAAVIFGRFFSKVYQLAAHRTKPLVHKVSFTQSALSLSLSLFLSPLPSRSRSSSVCLCLSVSAFLSPLN